MSVFGYGYAPPGVVPGRPGGKLRVTKQPGASLSGDAANPTGRVVAGVVVMSGDATDRAFVLGLDGVPWAFVEDWVADGQLPNLRRLVEEGAAGPLRSTRPANTPAAWPSIATGVWPDRHGIYEFVRPTPEYGQRLSTATDLRAPAVWDVLGPAAVGNVPMTYPASPIDGRMVTGMMTADRDPGGGFTHPPSLAEDVRERIPAYEVGLDWKEYYDREDAFLADLRELFEARRELLRLLLERAEPDPRLVFFVFTAPDRLQHLVWDREVLREQYALFDEVVGEALAICERRGYTLYVVSDHGFGPVDRLVRVNRILADEGYLARRESGIRGMLDAVGLTKDRVLDGLERVGVTDDLLVRALPGAVVDAAAGAVPGDHGLYDVDPSGTTAFLHGIGSVYVNDSRRFERGTVDPSAIPAVRRDLRDVLESVRDPATGERPLAVYEGEGTGGRDPDGPDLIVEARGRYRTDPTLGADTFAPAERAADHRPEGIFLAHGPHVEAGATPASATVVDVLPTLCHALGEPVPARADGRVLDEVFVPGSPPAERAVSSRRYAADGAVDDATDEDERGDDEASFDEVEERLRGLGYVE